MTYFFLFQANKDMRWVGVARGTRATGKRRFPRPACFALLVCLALAFVVRMKKAELNCREVV